MLDRSALKTFHPRVATPCFGEKLCLNYVLSVINFQRECIEAEMPFEFFFPPGDSLVTRWRNDCAIVRECHAGERARWQCGGG